MTNKVFKGVINGKEYTSKEEFLKDLENTSNLENVVYESSEENVKEGVDTTSLTETQKTLYNKWNALFDDLFGVNFDKLFAGYKAGTLKQAEQETGTKITELDSVQKPKQMSFNEFTDKYIMKPTTYQFDGTSKDDEELDKFDRYLSDKICDFKDDVTKKYLADLDTHEVQVQFETARKKSIADKSHVEKDIDNKSKEEYYRRTLVDALKSLGEETRIEQDKLDACNKELEALYSKSYYYDLLEDYYFELNEFITNKCH
jgi:hypothetical protein